MSNATATTTKPDVRVAALALLDRASAQVAEGRLFGSMEVLDLALDLRSALQDDPRYADVLVTLDGQLGFNAERLVANEEVAAFISAVRVHLDAVFSDN